jgi:hypothetical protein
MIRCLPQLIKNLKNTNSIENTFKSYNGLDWKNHVIYLYGAKHCYPVTLLKHKNMELVINGWRDNQTFHHYTNYSVLYTLVLEGSLLYDCKISDSNFTVTKSMQKTLHTGDFIITNPFSITDLTTVDSSVTLHLFHESYDD